MNITDITIDNSNYDYSDSTNDSVTTLMIDIVAETDDNFDKYSGDVTMTINR